MLKLLLLFLLLLLLLLSYIANVAILFCFEILVATAWYMPMLVASEIPWTKI